MARQVEAHADLFWVTSDNPRDEEPMEIIREILSGVSQSDRCRVQPDRELAIVEAVAEAGPDDVLLIAGKGHEKSQTIRGVDHPFDDVEVSGRVVRGVLHRLESEEKQAQPSLELQQRKAS